jgi:hypothetical protein
MKKALKDKIIIIGGNEPKEWLYRCYWCNRDIEMKDGGYGWAVPGSCLIDELKKK